MSQVRSIFHFSTSVGHLHPVLVQVGSIPRGAATNVDLIGGVNAHAAPEPVHKEKVGVLVVFIDF